MRRKERVRGVELDGRLAERGRIILAVAREIQRAESGMEILHCRAWNSRVGLGQADPGRIDERERAESDIVNVLALAIPDHNRVLIDGRVFDLRCERGAGRAEVFGALRGQAESLGKGENVHARALRTLGDPRPIAF